MTKLKTQPCKTCGGRGVLPADNVGPILREEREAIGVVGTDMAAYMGISPTFLRDLEKGARRWTNELLASYQAGLEELRNGRG